jgi:hypothetical protein
MMNPRPAPTEITPRVVSSRFIGLNAAPNYSITSSARWLWFGACGGENVGNRIEVHHQAIPIKMDPAG